MTKLQLTDERARIIMEAATEWLEIGRSTAPADFETAEAAITRLYAAINLPAPRFARFHSPLGAELFLNLVQKTWPDEMGANLRANLGDNLGANLWANLRANLRDNLRDNLWANLGANLRDNLGANLRANLWANLWANLRDNLGANLRDNLGANLRDNLGANLWANLGDNLGANLRDNLGANLGANLRANLWANLWDNLGANLRDADLRFTGTWFYGAWDYYWMWLDGGRRVGHVYPKREGAMLAEHVQISRSVGWWYPYGNICLVCDRPEILELDDQGRLHSENGPAMSFRDGYSIWALNGLRLTQQIIDKPETLTATQVRDEPNAETRRHMLDRYAGLRGSAAAGKWLADMGLTPISQCDITAKMQPSGLSIWRLSNGDAPVLCKLYRAEMLDDEPLVLLWVVCTSTAKEVFLRVPPHFTDAAQARDWTFGESLAEAVET